MSSTLPKRQHDVNRSTVLVRPAGPVRPARTAAGDAFTDLVVEVAWLGGIFTSIGEALGRLGGQTLARWVILDAIEDGPATVAQIARRTHFRCPFIFFMPRNARVFAALTRIPSRVAISAKLHPCT